MPEYLSPGVYVEEVPSAVQPIAGVGTSTAGFVGVVPDSVKIPDPDDPTKEKDFSMPAANDVKLCTSFAEFKKSFGDFNKEPGQNQLAHAVYGFFNNGGTRCYVTRAKTAAGINKALEAFEPVDDIAIVAAPGQLAKDAQTFVIDHCEKAGDRFAILDGQRTSDFTAAKVKGTVKDSDYAALYFPWIEVFDPVTAKSAMVPPSGHMAGVYARVDTQRGVHKAPANEVIRGALGVESRLSKGHQDGLNPGGLNVIRVFNGSTTVWGARTLGGDANTEWKYVPVRRLFIFLRESIDQGTKWVVFEPNDANLWAKIRRNVGAFLTNVWRSGALFGATPEEAFFVKCDAETNPSDVREAGQVVTEIGVAVVRPAEFVIFRISQWAGPGA